MSTVDLARAERADLVEFLSTLSPEQWAAPSLCAGWTVHDVVAHVVSYDELDVRGLLRRFARARFLPDRANAVGVDEYRRRTPQQLVALLADHLTPRGLTAGFGGAIALTDGLIHHQDIRRPLGRHRSVPRERLVAALRTALFSPIVRGVVRTRGLRLVATDIAWSFGRGAEVTGPGETMLMAVAGRPSVIDELTGPGRTTLAARLGA